MDGLSQIYIAVSHEWILPYKESLPVGLILLDAELEPGLHVPIVM